MSLKKIGLILISLMLLSGCGETLYSSGKGSFPYAVITPSFWAQATHRYQTGNLLSDLSPLNRICAFSIVWIWIALFVREARNGFYELWDFLGVFVKMVLIPLAVWLILLIFMAFLTIAIGLLTYALAENFYVIDPFFLSFLCIFIMIIGIAFLIFGPLSEMRYSPSRMKRSFGVTLFVLELGGVLFTITDMVKLFFD